MSMAVPGGLFEAAATALLDPSSSDRLGPEMLGLLRVLDCPLPAVPGAAERHRALLFRAAASFVRVFRLASEVAPGLKFFGAEVAPDAVAAEPGLPVAGVAGAGLSGLEAFEACTGEGIERLSAVEAVEDRVARQAPPAEVAPWLQPLLRSTAADPGWLAMRRQSDGGTVLVPLDLCLRRASRNRAFEPPWPLSIGCAASISPEGATLHGLLELIERDAVALWWRGGRRGRPVGLDEAAAAEAAARLALLRRHRLDRRTWLLDITTDVGVPSVAAVSFGRDGGGFCLGTAARPDLAGAASAAIMEMAQSELAIEVAEAKRRERGDAALNAADHVHLRRFRGIHAGRCALVHPTASGCAAADLPAGTAAGTLRAVLDRLARLGLEVLTLDLTRARFGVPVMRVLCPGLEREPSSTAGPRLAAALAATGGGDCHHGGIALM
ncbi:hypothetical protein GCM10009416_47390 [Craurococcus roseus]|uniref:YcaO domain-containing protein n=1 Tax=Craurococcus roseus TaxID=77585 RepID=A0ABP3RBL8_9PROT